MATKKTPKKPVKKRPTKSKAVVALELQLKGLQKELHRHRMAELDLLRIKTDRDEYYAAYHKTLAELKFTQEDLKLRKRQYEMAVDRSLCGGEIRAIYDPLFAAIRDTWRRQGQKIDEADFLQGLPAADHKRAKQIIAELIHSSHIRTFPGFGDHLKR